MPTIEGLGLAGGMVTLKDAGGTVLDATRIGKNYGGGFTNIGKTLSVNLEPVTDYNLAQPFLNVAHTARGVAIYDAVGSRVVTHDDTVATGNVDANGYVDAFDAAWAGNKVGYFWAWADTDQPFYDPHLGTYEFLYDGTDMANIASSPGANITIVSNTIGRVVFTITAPCSWQIEFLTINAMDYPRNFRVVKQSLLASFNAGAIFNPDFLADIADMSELRFMDWMNTNYTDISTWADYPTESKLNWEVVPISVQVALCNEVRADYTGNIPHLAAAHTGGVVDTAFATAYATYVKANLHDDLVFRPEFSNETWNGAYSVHNWLQTQAESDGWPTADTSRRGWAAKINVAQADAISSVYGDEADARLEYVCGSGRAQTTWTDEMVSGDLWKAQEPGEWTDPILSYQCVTIACYFGSGYLTNNTTEVNALIARIDAGDTLAELSTYIAGRISALGYAGDSVAEIAASATIIHAAGMTMRAYEGGPHVHHNAPGTTTDERNKMVPALEQFSYSADVVPFLTTVWDAWELHGDGPFSFFKSIDNPSQYGSFSIRRYLGEVNAKATYVEGRNGSPTPWWPDNRDPTRDVS